MLKQFPKDELNEYIEKHPEIKEFLQVWNISRKEYEKALKKDNSIAYPLGDYSTNS